jgi:hypothetical protein
LVRPVLVAQVFLAKAITAVKAQTQVVVVVEVLVLLETMPRGAQAVRVVQERQTASRTVLLPDQAAVVVEVRQAERAVLAEEVPVQPAVGQERRVVQIQVAEVAVLREATQVATAAPV